MATRNISLDDEAYARLKKLKREGDSFSEVVKRVTDDRSLLELAGIWEDDKEVEEAIKEGRRSKERSDRIAEKMRDIE